MKILQAGRARSGTRAGYRRWTQATVLAAAIACTVGVSSALANIPSPGGQAVSCSTNGTTVTEGQQVPSPACLSDQTAFYGYQPNYARYCAVYGYEAYVYSTSNQQRYKANFCADGLWHFSGLASANEPRYALMQIALSGVSFTMLNYRR